MMCGGAANMDWTQTRNSHNQGRSQEFATGNKRGGLGDGSPQQGPGAEYRWESGGKAGPEAGDMLNIRLKKIHKNSTQQK